MSAIQGVDRVEAEGLRWDRVRLRLLDEEVKQVGAQVRQAARVVAMLCAVLLLVACAARDIELMPGDRFDLTGRWTVIVPDEAEGFGQVYDQSGSGDSGPLRGVSVFRADGDWSVNAYEAEDLSVVQQGASQAENALSSGGTSIRGVDAHVVVARGDASGDAFHVLHVFVRGSDEEGIHITGSAGRVEQAVGEGLPFDELARLAVEQSGLQDR